MFGLADFGRYVVDSDVSRFTRAGHDEPMPLRDKPHYEGAQDLSETNEESFESLDLDRLLGERRRWIVPEPPAKYEYPGEEVRRWIFRRVIDLGWTPERFAAFHERLSSSGRDSHKPERFGKKY